MAAAKPIFSLDKLGRRAILHQVMIRPVFILVLSAALGAHAESAADKLTAAGIAEFRAAYEAWDGARFTAASETFRRATTNASATVTNFYWLGAAEFHRMLQLQNSPGSATNEAWSVAAREAAVDALKTAVTLDQHHAESQALLGTLYGMKINGNLVRGLRFGPRVQKHQRLALATGADNPRVQYLLGMCQFHTAKDPAAWREALATLLAAEKLFASEAKATTAPLAPRWGHDSCLTFIGRTYELLGQPKEAADYFRRALAIHPQDHLAQAGLKRVGAKK
jgi:tetratricopeptide (TPR) repeat protein